MTHSNAYMPILKSFPRGYSINAGAEIWKATVTNFDFTMTALSLTITK